MSLTEALLCTVLAALAIVAMGSLGGAAARARLKLDQDLVGGYAVDGFLEEAARTPDPPAIRATRLDRFRWVERWVRPEAPGPTLERRTAHGSTRVVVRFRGAAPRELAGES